MDEESKRDSEETEGNETTESPSDVPEADLSNNTEEGEEIITAYIKSPEIEVRMDWFDCVVELLNNHDASIVDGSIVFPNGSANEALTKLEKYQNVSDDPEIKKQVRQWCIEDIKKELRSND